MVQRIDGPVPVDTPEPSEWHRVVTTAEFISPLETLSQIKRHRFPRHLPLLKPTPVENPLESDSQPAALTGEVRGYLH